MAELKPCPCCRCKTIRKLYNGPVGEGFIRRVIFSVTVYCAKCKLQITRKTEKGAIDAWNKRS